MPPLDPSISLGFRLPQVDSPLQTYGQAMTLRNAMLQGDIAQRGITDDAELRRVLAASGGDLGEAQKALMQSGLYKPAMEIGKAQREQRVQDTTIAKNTAEAQKDRIANQRERLVPVNDQAGYENWLRSIVAEDGMQHAQALPQQFTPEVKTGLLMKADEAVARLAPKVEPKRERFEGDMVVQEERQPNGTWREIGRGPRFAKQVGPTINQEAPVTPVTIQDPQDPNGTIIIDGRTRAVLGKGPKLTDVGKMEAKRQFNMQGIGATIQAAEDILTGRGGEPMPTGSGFGTAVDYAASLIGVSPEGSKQADQMRALGGALVAKMPRMEGPQSDKDVALYRESAGRIGDSSLPIARRKAALETVKDLWTKYERLNPEAFAGGGGTGGAGGMPSPAAIDAEIARRRGGR